MRYATLGELPSRRHAARHEEVVGHDGRSGNESILYHVGSQKVAAVGAFRALTRARWISHPAGPRIADTNRIESGGGPVSGRRVVMWNEDVEVSIAKPTRQERVFYRNTEGDEILYIHRGAGVLRTVFGRVPFAASDYVVIPRGTTSAFELSSGEQFWLCFHTPGEIETPTAYRNRYGQLLEHAPFSERDFRPPHELETHRESGEYLLTLRVREGLQDYLLDGHPFDVVGWDGYVWPYAFNAADFVPRAGRYADPLPTHQTFQGPGFVISTLAPQLLEWEQGARRRRSLGECDQATFRADGLIDLGARESRTDGLEVRLETLRPLALTELWRAIDM